MKCLKEAKPDKNTEKLKHSVFCLSCASLASSSSPSPTSKPSNSIPNLGCKPRRIPPEASPAGACTVERDMEMDGGGEGGRTEWKWRENKVFENALAQHFMDGGGEPEMERIAAAVPGKSVEEVVEQYRLLEEDVDLIDSGQVALPEYLDDGSTEQGGGKKAGGQVQERRKGVAWSEEEHKQFLNGLRKFGKGDWRSIARHFVLTRTPTQVASHAQKYFNRLKASNKDRRRSSIHDITIVDNADASDPQRTITTPRVGAMLPPVITAPTVGMMLPNGMPGMQTPRMPVLPSGVNLYGVSPHANLPVGRIPNMPYPMQVPVIGAPMKFPPKSDQLLHPSSNR